MGIGRNGAVRRQLRTLFNIGAVRELTDGQLLERFASANDRGEVAELAFAVLVERHGPMVMRVCRGVLGDRDEAQDAFQATFLVLVKRARGLWVRDSIGPWLHQVACRTARCARGRLARHRRLERIAARDEAVSAADRDFELERMLHEEIDRLPERFRSPVILCDLEGRSYEQVARHLGWPVGTVKSRLSRGRECLRDRLIRRGIGREMGLSVVGVCKAATVSIPPALLDATTAAAWKFAAARSSVGGAAVSLASGVLRTMTMSQWWKVATALVVAGVSASGAGWVGAGGAPAKQARPVDPGVIKKDLAAGEALTFTVKRGDLEFLQSSRGIVEAGRASDVYCNVEGGTTIIKIVPEGRRVKKGVILAELDSDALKDKLVNQRITNKSAEAIFLNSRLTREVAEVALKEYLEGIYVQALISVKGEIAGHGQALRKLGARLDRTRRALEAIEGVLNHQPGPRSTAEIVHKLDVQDRVDEAELGRDRERFALEQAESKLNTLEKYTKEKTVKELESEVRKAHSDELARQAAWELEKSKEDKLERQIANCTLVAPIDGLVVYANDPSRMRGRNQSQVEEGAAVRLRQKIISIVDPNAPMRINLKVPEAWVDQLAPKMKARIKVDAFADQVFEGEVVSIAPIPDPDTFYASDIKVYSTRIRINQTSPSLRPGMTAEAEIVIARRDDVIAVPVGAFYPRDGKPQLAVKRPDGNVEWREVVVGVGDEQKVEVKEGLREGDEVILDPSRFLTDAQRGRMKAARSAARKKAARRKGQAGPSPE